MTQIKASRIEYRDGLGRGEVLEMADGSVWFHPFSGLAPRCEKRSDRDERLEKGA